MVDESQYLRARMIILLENQIEDPHLFQLEIQGVHSEYCLSDCTIFSISSMEPDQIMKEVVFFSRESGVCLPSDF